MTSLFASQFGPGAPYQPISLDTGTLSVGANLPRLPNNKKPPEEKNPGESSGKSSPSGTGITTGAGAVANASALQAAQSQIGQITSTPVHATVPGHASATAGANAANAAVNAGHAVAENQPVVVQGHLNQAHVASPLDNLGHWAAHTFDSARHGIASGADAVNNFAQSPAVGDVMNFGNPIHTPGLISTIQQATASTPAPQDIPSSNLRINPVYDPGKAAKALPRGWSANSAVESGASRPAIEAPGASVDPLQSLIQRPAYSAMPRGWSANVNPTQFSSGGTESAVPKGLSANGGWIGEAESILGDIADGLG